MPSPDATGPVVAHVQRTADPGVLRWVVHEPVVAGPRRVVPASDVSPPLGELIVSGAVAAVVAGPGYLELTAGPGGWTDVAALDAAVCEALAAGAPWLAAGADAGDGAAAAALADLQRVVTAAAGSLTALHGGSIEVVALDGPTLTVRMHGTCAGCSFTDATLERLVLPALRREAPTVQTVTITHD